jgi:hypothetical protein
MFPEQVPKPRRGVVLQLSGRPPAEAGSPPSNQVGAIDLNRPLDDHHAARDRAVR